MQSKDVLSPSFCREKNFKIKIIIKHVIVSKWIQSSALYSVRIDSTKRQFVFDDRKQQPRTRISHRYVSQKSKIEI